MYSSSLICCTWYLKRMRLDAVWLLEPLVQPAELISIQVASVENKPKPGGHELYNCRGVLSSSKWKCIDGAEKQVASTKPCWINRGVQRNLHYWNWHISRTSKFIGNFLFSSLKRFPTSSNNNLSKISEYVLFLSS